MRAQQVKTEETRCRKGVNESTGGEKMQKEADIFLLEKNSIFINMPSFKGKIFLTNKRVLIEQPSAPSTLLLILLLILGGVFIGLVVAAIWYGYSRSHKKEISLARNSIKKIEVVKGNDSLAEVGVAQITAKSGIYYIVPRISAWRYKNIEDCKSWVKTFFKSKTSISYVNPKILKYIKEQKKAGYSKADINSALKEAGYSEEEIEAGWEQMAG